MSRAEQIEDIAARWLLRREELNWSASDEAALEAWLEIAPEHRVSFWRLEHGWSQVHRITALGSMPSARQERCGVVCWRHRIAAAAVLLVFVGVFGILVRHEDAPDMQTYATDIGGRENISLSDGSKIELNTVTRLRASVGVHRREVWLYGGEAYFEVVHDPHRPFVVHAGSRTVTVAGTKFSIRRDGDKVQVAVFEGRVTVADANAGAMTPAVLTPGGIAVAEGSSILVAPASPKRVNAELSWRRGMLTFDQDTLQEAAVEFNRYNRKQLVIADTQVAKIRIGGAFEADNVEGFARLLRQAYGLRVDDEGTVIKISN